LKTCRRLFELETAPGRLLPWLPVAFGSGIALYFAAEQEPSISAALLALGATAALAVLARRWTVAFPVLLGAAAVAAGFATGAVKQRAVSHPVLARPAFNVMLSGFVLTAEERERSDRIVVIVHTIAGLQQADELQRVRLSVRKGTAPPVGSFVSLKARLTPPLQPLRPGGYDFARDLYFQRIGASGFVTGSIKIEPAPVSLGFGLRIATAIEGIRDAIDGRIRAVVKGDAGSIASALLTGKRDAISTPVNDAMYVSSLAHVLSISGYHMAVVAGVVLFVIRALLAAVPPLAKRFPIKKWSAAAALFATTFYLFLSGAEVATQRSYIMIAIVLVGVLVDRPALTMRTIALAALGVLLLTPEAVVHPSFQMSFAATLALVAGYERGVPFLKAGADTSLGARLALWGVREVAMLIMASLLAGFATTPYAAFHFHRAAPYGVIANLLAMPVVSALVMPAGMIGIIAMPFGFDAPFWKLMEVGITWMDMVALWVASLPGAIGRVPAFGVGPLLLATMGLLVLCLLRTWWRWTGAAFVAVACLLAASTRQPDVYVAPGGDAVAVRGRDGRLVFAKAGSDAFAIREWLAADADPRRPNDKALLDGFVCDRDGCAAPFADGFVTLAKTAEGVSEDCARAVLVVTRRLAPPDCAAPALDRSRRRSGAIVLWRQDGSWREQAALPEAYGRPWSGLRQPRAAEEADATPNAAEPQDQ
jgi:competence protein ComEC